MSSCKKYNMSAYIFIHLVEHLQLSFWWFLLQVIDFSSVFVWLLNQFHLVAIYWLVCRDRNSPLCHVRVSLTSCIGAGHIIFFAGIDSTGHQVTRWNPNFILGFFFLFVCIVSMYVVIFLCFLLVFVLFSLVYVSFCFPDYFFDKYHLPSKLLHFYGLPIPCRLLV